MISVSGKNWEEIKVSKRIIEKLKIDLGFDEILAKLIISRKFNQTEIELTHTVVDIFNPFLASSIALVSPIPLDAPKINAHLFIVITP